MTDTHKDGTSVKIHYSGGLVATRSATLWARPGEGRIYEREVTRTDGSTTTAQTIYFATDRRDTQDNTPGFTPLAGVEFLPQLPGSGYLRAA